MKSFCSSKKNATNNAVNSKLISWVYVNVALTWFANFDNQYYKYIFGFKISPKITNIIFSPDTVETTVNENVALTNLPISLLPIIAFEPPKMTMNYEFYTTICEQSATRVSATHCLFV